MTSDFVRNKDEENKASKTFDELRKRPFICDGQKCYFVLTERQLVFWTTGLLDNWTFGQLDFWTTGLFDNWSFGQLVFWTTGLLDNWTFDNWTFGQLGFWTTGLLDNWSF